MITRATCALCATLTLLAACADPATPYPDLVPTSRMLAQPVLDPDAAAPETTTDATKARAAALKARAGTLRRPVIPPDLRNRMQQTAGQLRQAE
ncbi:hypothetical protein [Paracoccus sp. (in: a-proteobacteria)]|uniref:hypothetical protein n=1 Tax=Paracoccus sp. TaxID=267 RepID=UPI003A83AA7B